jgi:hypothetical protein
MLEDAMQGRDWRTLDISEGSEPFLERLNSKSSLATSASEDSTADIAVLHPAFWPGTQTKT